MFLSMLSGFIVIMYRLFFLCLVICLVAGTQGFAEEELLHRQVRQWVQQLGDDSFYVRQRAELFLIRAGIQAYPELQRAKQSPDIEIVRRAEHVLSQIEQVFLEMENWEAAFWIQLYMIESNPAFKARIIWTLADPTLDLTKGEGLQTLCRLVRFEENDVLRVEAAKSLIASPPVSPMLRQKWYRHIRDNTYEIGDDELLQCLTHYVKLWCDLNDAEEKITPYFQERVRQVGAETLRLLERPENRIQIGSRVDLLLHYAVAELQDIAGLTEDRDKTVAAALALQTEPIQSSEPIQPIGLEDDMLMNEHFYVGRILWWRYRLYWAMAHFQKVVETGDIVLRVRASREVAEIAMYLADYSAAADHLDTHIEILKDPSYELTDAAAKIAQAQKRKFYCLAEKAASEGNWKDVREALMKSWSVPGPPDNHNRDPRDSGDDVLLAYRLCKRQPDIDREFKDKMDSLLIQTWRNIDQDYKDRSFDERSIKMLNACNSAAWLLANTEGDYQIALTLVETALKAEPDNADILDTLAHVYFLGDKFDAAIRTQEQVVRLAPEAVIFQRALERFKRVKFSAAP